MRDGKWKLVSKFPDAWELHDMEADRTEMHDRGGDVSGTGEVDGGCLCGLGGSGWACMKWPMKETPAGEREGTMGAPAYLQKDRP